MLTTEKDVFEWIAENLPERAPHYSGFTATKVVDFWVVHQPIPKSDEERRHMRRGQSILVITEDGNIARAMLSAMPYSLKDFAPGELATHEGLAWVYPLERVPQRKTREEVEKRLLRDPDWQEKLAKMKKIYPHV